MSLLSGLSVCSRLSKLSVSSEPSAALLECSHLLAGWLPHVHTLACCDDKGGRALVRALAAQLQRLEVRSDRDAPTARMARLLRECNKLLTVSVPSLYPAILDSLLSLTHLTDVTVQGPVKLQSRQATAWWTGQKLSLSSLDVKKVARLPLSGLEQLTIRDELSVTLKPSLHATHAAVLAACTALAQVPVLQLGALEITNREDGEWNVEDRDCGPYFVAVMRAMQPIAHRLPSLKLKLDWAWEEAQLGQEILDGLQQAGVVNLTKLGIGPYCEGDDECGWSLDETFWAGLPEALPALQTLELWHMAGRTSLAAGIALHMMCARLQQAGRPFEIVFHEPEEPDALEAAVAMQLMHPCVRMRVEQPAAED